MLKTLYNPKSIKRKYEEAGENGTATSSVQQLKELVIKIVKFVYQFSQDDKPLFHTKKEVSKSYLHSTTNYQIPVV